jgi:GrpB-like predicted nucleotidyltransferase (UPF0157 family)
MMIAIVPYDVSWPPQYATEADAVRHALGLCAIRVEHVGSTSVPGLAAKPVIDIQVSVPTLEPLSRYLQPLAGIGYTHVPLGEFDAVYPFFQKPITWPSTHHVHLCVVGSEQERRHIAFRDYLRKNPAVAAEYLELKRELAAANHGATLESRERYSLSKSQFVLSVLERALAEAIPCRTSRDA